MGNINNVIDNIDLERLYKDLGKKLRSLRRARNWSQEDMWEHGFSPRYYQRVETGKPTKLQTSAKLSVVFDVTLSELFEGIVIYHKNKPQKKKRSRHVSR